jgi:hypothetical protein
MGKLKQNAVGDNKFVPRISSASRKIAARRFEQAALTNATPHYMNDTYTTSKVKLAPISTDENTLFTKVNKEIFENSKESDTDETKRLSKREVLKPIAMSKQPSVLLDDNVFTFRPKVSTASAKIVESMGTDFMSRQQQHLEKQKKLVSIPMINRVLT